MRGKSINKKVSFGTMPVFMTAISTILGAIVFLRFGWAVGNLGFVGVIGLIIMGHLITIPTALAVAEIATNQKVLGGGAYYIISRSFGLNIGGAIGITLYLSQALSVAFYIIAFAEAFDPVIQYLSNEFGFLIYDKRAISIPVMALLSVLILTRGVNFGMKALYFVVALLFAAIILFFLGGSSPNAPAELNLNAHIPDNTSFFKVFIIIFPAFTGLAAGLGLSGDLRNPQKSIPRGTIWATIAGLVVYVFVALKLTMSASPEELNNDQLIMQKIALWGPIIPIGLAAACLSSAIGSIMIAPRTLQALGIDDIFPNKFFNRWFAKGKKGSNEPINGSIITIIIAFIFIGISKNGINFVAEIISMFFMVTYGAICLISFLEHFAADPAYRPTFKSRWYFSLLGTILSFWVMFKMDMFYAVMSLSIMAIIYFGISSSHKKRRGLEKLFKGVVFQLSRSLQIFAQRADKEDRDVSWRPFAICVSEDSFKRRSAFDLLRWVSYKYGFGTYIHYIKGMLTPETLTESKVSLNRLIHLAKGGKNRVYLDTIISPSYTSAIAQVVQLSGITGKGNNMILFEFSRTDPSTFQHVLKDYALLESTGFDICVLNSSYKGYGYKKEIHIWLTPKDYENGNLMILLAYIILGHPDWKKGFIKIFALYPEKDMEFQKEKLYSLIKSGRLPISPNNIELLSYDESGFSKSYISRYSADADLTIIGFQNDNIKGEQTTIFNDYKDIGNILFVNSNKQKEIK